MLVNKELIEETIVARKKNNDFVKEFSYRYKTSLLDQWSDFVPYSEDGFQEIYGEPLVDGVKLKFRYTTLVINGRHSKK